MSPFGRRLTAYAQKKIDRSFPKMENKPALCIINNMNYGAGRNFPKLSELKKTHLY